MMYKIENLKNLSPIMLSLLCLLCLACENSVSENEYSTEGKVVDDTFSLSESHNNTSAVQVKIKPLPPEHYGSSAFDEIGWELMESEALGGITIGMDSIEVMNILGQPDSISQAIFWEADGGFHFDWYYSKKGITIGMNKISDLPNKPAPQSTVDRISLYAPGEFSTNRSISIGSTINEVKSNYQKAIEDTIAYHNTLVAGTIYGGLVFQFQNDTVVKIFLGAAAE